MASDRRRNRTAGDGRLASIDREPRRLLVLNQEAVRLKGLGLGVDACLVRPSNSVRIRNEIFVVA